MTRFARVDMDSIAPLLPSNKVAARVAGRGEHFEFKARDTHIHSDMPLPVRLPIPAELQNPTYVELKGKVVGRLTVQGIFDGADEGKGTRWVCRCVCSSYEVRRSKYLKSRIADGFPPGEEPMCMWCNKTRSLQLGFGIVRDGPLVKAEDAR